VVASAAGAETIPVGREDVDDSAMLFVAKSKMLVQRSDWTEAVK
jgi:hypothetical protein